MKVIPIMEGTLPLQIDLFTSNAGLMKAIFRPSSAFCCRFVKGNPIEEIVLWLKSYSQKRPMPLNFPLDWEGLTDFQKKGLKHLSSIPWGHVQFYGEIGEKLGRKGLARAIGMVCRTNPWPLFIPCHRVIASRGKIGGFAYGLPIKELLLEFEGVSAL